MFLEEQVAIVNYVSLQIEFIHETAGSLHSLLLQLSLLLFGIKLSSLTLFLIQNLKEEGTAITLDRSSTELASLSSSNCTAQSRLAGSCSLYEDRS